MSQPIVDVAHTAECTCQHLLLGVGWVKPILIRTWLAHLLLAFLSLDVALDGFQGHASNGPAIVGVGPQRGQFLLEMGKLLPQLVSGCSLEVFHQAVNAEVWKNYPGTCSPNFSWPMGVTPPFLEPPP